MPPTPKNGELEYVDQKIDRINRTVNWRQRVTRREQAPKSGKFGSGTQRLEKEVNPCLHPSPTQSQGVVPSREHDRSTRA